MTPTYLPYLCTKVELRRGKLAQRGRLHDQYMACPAGCGENFMRRNARAHARYRCIMRVVGCSIAGCEKRMPAKDIPRYYVVATSGLCVLNAKWATAECGWGIVVWRVYHARILPFACVKYLSVTHVKQKQPLCSRVCSQSAQASRGVLRTILSISTKG